MTITTTGESAVIAHLRALSARQNEARQTRTRTVNGVPARRDAVSSQQSAKSTVAVEPATERMKRFIDDLLVERVHVALTDDVIADIKNNKPQAHRFINYLLAQPRVEAVTEPAPALVEATPAPAEARTRLNFAEIPDGNYAIDEGAGLIKFYRVSTGKRGYKEVQVRASDELHSINWKAGIAILHKIVAAGLAESRLLFATSLGRCCRCGRSLTDQESRDNAKVNGGYGPDCAGK